jgi:hypothetical protein
MNSLRSIIGYEYLGQLPKDVLPCGYVFSFGTVSRMHKLKQKGAFSTTYNYMSYPVLDVE